MFYVAVDQHSKQLTVSVRDEAGDVVLRRQVSTEWERVRQFWADIRERSSTAGGFVVILEVCGFNDWLVAMVREYASCMAVGLIPNACSAWLSRRSPSRADSPDCMVFRKWR
ncbi:MAG: hypothetical protein NT013_23255, partial [Planctomycetia bacterium]|nr:hypothetical protein [Planctomycetia bacterium]